MDVEKTLLEHSESLSSEEKERIYEEIDEMVMKTKTGVDNFDFSTKEAKIGLQFPLTIIISLVLLLSGSIFGVWLYSMRAEQSVLTLNANKINSEALLAKILIEENKKKAVEAENKIKNIESNLQTALDERKKLEENFESRVAERKRELEQKVDAELSALREKLAQEGTNQQEIDKLLEEERKKIENQNNQQINAFRSQLDEEKAALTSEYEQQVENLRLQQLQQESALVNLQSEIEQRETALEEQAQQTSIELAAAQENLNQLRNNKEARDRAIRTFDIYFRNIKQNITAGDYNKALGSIQQGRSEINKSAFSTDQIASIYLSAFDIQENIIKNLIAFQDEASNDIAGQTALLSNNITTITRQLEQAQEDLQRTQNLLTQEQNEKQQNRNTIQSLQNDIQKTEQQLNNTLTRLENASNTYSTVEANLRYSQESTLSNIENIIAYINDRESGTANEEQKQEITDLLQRLPIYHQIGTILTQQITKSETAFP